LKRQNDISSSPNALSVLDSAEREAFAGRIKEKSVEEKAEWPTEILLQFLHFLAIECDRNAVNAWNQLAYLVCKRDGLAQAARRMTRPILLRIKFEYGDPDTLFKIPFMQATSVCVDIDWGDGCVNELREKGAGYADHKYAAPGEYAVRILPARDNEICLDHLGFQNRLSTKSSIVWWRPLREIVSLGRCGLRSLSYLFAYSFQLKVNLQDLRVEEIEDLNGMFFAAKSFDQPIGGWNVSKVTDMSYMFYGATNFNQCIGSWDVSKVTNMSGMFASTAEFNQPIGAWNVKNVSDMSHMFRDATKFNQPIGEWITSSVGKMTDMFFEAVSFNQPIGSWDVGHVTDMSYMFYEASEFNQPIGNWNVSNVTRMECMFFNAFAFNQPLGDWETSNVTDMGRMFYGARAFNQPIGHWKVGKVTDMSHMFQGALAFDLSDHGELDASTEEISLAGMLPSLPT
jgi:surface protein